jgi:serine protease
MGSFGPNGGQVEAIDPIRLVDTRGGAGPMVVGVPQVIQVRGQAGVPADATAVILNVTAGNAHGYGYFSVWPTGVAEPTSSNVNFDAGQSVPNMVMVKLGADGSISVKDSVNRADLIIDVFGYVR